MSIVIALQSATVYISGGRPANVRKGEAWHSESAAVKAQPSLFSADDSYAKGAPEVATAKPKSRRVEA